MRRLLRYAFAMFALLTLAGFVWLSRTAAYAKELPPLRDGDTRA